VAGPLRRSYSEANEAGSTLSASWGTMEFREKTFHHPRHDDMETFNPPSTLIRIIRLIRVIFFRTRSALKSTDLFSIFQALKIV